MASKNNNNNDGLQNTKHCVLIDGNCGRHELFSNIHPYTLNRLDKLNDAFTFRMHSEEAVKLMNNPSYIHYHIFYNSFSVEIDKYYKILKMIYPQSVWLHSSIYTAEDRSYTEDSSVKIEEVISTHSCDSIWIIHGIENHCEKLVARLKSSNNSKANIFSYCWLENLENGSNRIEYLVHNKIYYPPYNQIEKLSKQVMNMNVSKDDQSNEHPSTQLVVDEGTTTMWMPTTVEEKTVKCNFDGCKKKFKNGKALKDHQAAKHSSTQSVINEETTVVWAPTTEKPRKSTQTKKKKKVTCDLNSCKEEFKNDKAMKDHQSAKHSSTQSVINEETTTKVEPKKAKQTTAKPKMTCSFGDCEQSFKTRGALQKHQIKTHPIPVLCLFSDECLDSNEKYPGISGLQEHMISQHADSFPRQNCPIPTCKNTKCGHDWFAALQHISISHRKYLFKDVIWNTTERELTTNIACWDTDGPFQCIYNGCGRLYWKEKILKRHEAFAHPVALRCPFGCECQQSARVYVGFSRLCQHVISNHAPWFSQPTCFDSECKFEEKKPFKSWPHVVRHILGNHLSAIEIIPEPTASSTIKTHETFKKCSYDTCNKLFSTKQRFLHHLVTCHPYPLRCPYNAECDKIFGNNGEGYLGLMELERHIRTEHPVQFQESICFNSKCQEETKFQRRELLVQHILGEKHWLDIKLN